MFKPFTLLVVTSFSFLFAQIHDECGTNVVSKSLTESILSHHFRYRDTCSEDNHFLIRKDIYSFDASDVESNYECKEFILAEFDNFTNIYIEKSEYENGNISDAAISTLFTTFTENTPNAPLEYQNGIKNAEELMLSGNPPNVDGTGKVNILLLDVQDGYNGSGSYVAGYFDALDQEINSECVGNCKDIIYIDSYPGNLTSANPERALFTLAHEYQHLLHFASDNCEGYFTNCHNPWLNEGLSDLMPSILGLGIRDYSPFLSNTTISLDAWADPGENTAPFYAKSALFMQFLYEYYEYGIGTEFENSQDAITVIFNDNEDQGVESLVNTIGMGEFYTLFREFITSLSIATLPSETTIGKPKAQLSLDDMQVEMELEFIYNYDLPTYSSVNIEIPNNLILLELTSFGNPSILTSNFEHIIEPINDTTWYTDSTYYTNLILSMYTTNNSSTELKFLLQSANYSTTLEKNFVVYPNPTLDSYLYCKIESNYTNYSNILNVSLHNLLGQKLSNYKFTGMDSNETNILDVSNLRSGIYFLVLSDNSHSKKTKFTIIK